MILRHGLLCLFLVLSGLPAAAQEKVSARVTWYGVYTAQKTEEIVDPTSPTGKRYVSTPVAPKVSSDRIPGNDKTRFGFEYVLSGKRGSTVTVTHVYRFPAGGMPDANTGAFRTTYEMQRQDKIGEPVLFGWSFDGAPPERILAGAWTLEVWQGQRKLLERRFTVEKQ